MLRSILFTIFSFLVWSANSNATCQVKLDNYSADDFLLQYLPEESAPSLFENASFTYTNPSGQVKKGSASCDFPAMGSRSNGASDTCTVTMQEQASCNKLPSQLSHELLGHWGFSEVKLSGVNFGHVLANANDYTVKSWRTVAFITCAQQSMDKDDRLFLLGSTAENTITSVFACKGDDVSLSNCNKKIMACRPGTNQ